MEARRAGDALARKGNQGSLREDATCLVTEQTTAGFKDGAINRSQTVGGEHGPIEIRTATVIHDMG